MIEDSRETEQLTRLFDNIFNNFSLLYGQFVVFLGIIVKFYLYLN